MYFSNSHPSRLLPTPAGPDTRTNRGCRRSTEAWNSSRIMRISTPRPISGASSPSTRCAPPIAETTRVARHSRSGSTLPLSWCSPSSSNADRARRQPPGRAVDEHRAGRGDGLDARRGVHRVAGDHPLVRRPDRHGDLAGHDAGPRPRDRRRRLRHRAGGRPRRGSRPARTARSASSSVATGVPHTAITASPMNFSTTPAVAADDGSRRLEVAGQQLAHLLGVIGLRARREPDEIAEQHRAHPSFGDRLGRRWRREPGAVVGGGHVDLRRRSHHRTACRPRARLRRSRTPRGSIAPHSPQNRLSAGLIAPHCPHSTPPPRHRVRILEVAAGCDDESAAAPVSSAAAARRRGR